MNAHGKRFRRPSTEFRSLPTMKALCLCVCQMEYTLLSHKSNYDEVKVVTVCFVRVVSLFVSVKQWVQKYLT